MQRYAKSCLIASALATFLVTWIGLQAQEINRPPDPELLARLSYESSALAQADGTRHICVAVSRDGDYRMVQSKNSGPSDRLQGRMPKADLQALKTLLGSAGFRSLTGSHGALIRQDAESFTAEVSTQEDGVQHLQWLNADGENPFPEPVAKVADWLRNFEPKNGKPFEYAEYPDVCPSSGLRLLQPSIATSKQP